MNCTECDGEMRQGFLFASKDGAFSFADEVPGIFKNAKNTKGFVEITPLKANHRTQIPAFICEKCRSVVIKY